MTDPRLPHQCTALIGHREAQQQLEAAFDSGRMPHAWLLTGLEGIGKASLGYLFAHMILSGGENRLGRMNPEHPAARLIAAESHPDLFVLRRPEDEKTGAVKDVIPVEAARALAPFLSLTAARGHGRVALIDEAHALNVNGQNAILKMIEEPPPGTTMILTATTIGMMLPTIRSRCRVLAMNGLTDNEISVILNRQGIEVPTGAVWAQMCRHAEGSAGRAIRILQADVLPLFDEVMAVLSGLPDLDIARLHALADQIGKKAESDRYEMVSHMITGTLRRAVRGAAAGESDDPANLMQKLAPQGHLLKALDLWERVEKTLASATAAALDRKLVFINAITDMSRTMG